MDALKNWVSSIIGEPVVTFDEGCLLKILNKCSSCQSPSTSSTEKIRNFFNGVYGFQICDIVHWDKLYDDFSECELVAILLIIGGMQTQSANYFVNAALALDADVQSAIYAIIQHPMTRISNEARITRDDVLQVLQLNTFKTEHQKLSINSPSTSDEENGDNDENENMQSFVTSTPVSQHKQVKKSSQGNTNPSVLSASTKSPPRPNTLKMSENIQLMPPPPLPPQQRHYTFSGGGKNPAQPLMSPLTPLKTLVESPHWNVKSLNENALNGKVRLHEAEQRARAAELSLARAEAEREDIEAVVEELRQQLSDSLKRVQVAETEVARLRRDALLLRDQRDELVEAKVELVLQAERLKMLEEKLAEAQASGIRVRELENATKELECQLNDRNIRIASLLQKFSEIKNREVFNVELETLRLRLKDAEAQLAEELQGREALERDVRSQETMVQQMQIDRRIAEKRSRSQHQHQHLETTRPFGNTEDPLAQMSFDVSMSAITTNLAPISTNGENLGSVFHCELESSRIRIDQLEQMLREATAHASDTEFEASRLRDALDRLQKEASDMETALVMAQEERAAADIARHHIAADLSTLEGRLAFEITAAGLLTPEVISFAESLSAIFVMHNADMERLAERLRVLEEMEKSEAAVQTSVETNFCSASQQTEETEEETPEQEKETIRLKDKLTQVSDCLCVATDQLSQLQEQLAAVQAECRQERALSARAHHNCELNEREARRFHALLEHHRSATAAFLASLEHKGLIERGTSLSASFIESDVSHQLNSVFSQVLLSVGNLEDVLKENGRLKTEVNLLRLQAAKSRDLEKKLHQLDENSEQLESELYRLIRKQIRPRDNLHIERQKSPDPSRLPIEEGAQDTEDDSLVYTDLSQVSSRLPFSSSFDVPRGVEGCGKPMTQSLRCRLVESNGDNSMPPPPLPPPFRPPIAFDISPSASVTGRRRRQLSPAPPPTRPQSITLVEHDNSEGLSTVSNLTQSYPAAHNGNIRSRNANTAPISDPSEDLYTRMHELRRRNQLQPVHLRTNYPIETQLQNPDRLCAVLQTVHKSDLKQHSKASLGIDSTSVGKSRKEDSPVPAGRSLPPKGLQSISEVLLTGASGTVDVEHVDLSSTRARPTESLLLPHSGQIAAAGIEPSLPTATAKKAPLAFELELSPQRRRNPPPPLIQRKKLPDEASQRLEVSRGTDKKAMSTATSASAFKSDWATPSAIVASNSRRPLKETTGKVNRRF